MELAARLRGTEMWYQSAYTWSVVAMATAIRSVLSARECKKTLSITQAIDTVANVGSHAPFFGKEGYEALLRHPNMRETGQLPGFCLFHVGMRVRLTQTVDPPAIVVDAAGVVVDIDFDDREPALHKSAISTGNPSVVVLEYVHHCVYVRLDDEARDFLLPNECSAHTVAGADRQCPDCKFFPGLRQARHKQASVEA